MEMLTTLITYGVATIAALAFIVSLITEVIKGIGPLKKVPTDLVVLVLSCVITVVAYFCMNAYYGRAFLWYELIATIIASFIVAFVAMNGWDKLSELWLRFKK